MWKWKWHICSCAYLYTSYMWCIYIATYIASKDVACYIFVFYQQFLYISLRATIMKRSYNLVNYPYKLMEINVLWLHHVTTDDRWIGVICPVHWRLLNFVYSVTQTLKQKCCSLDQSISSFSWLYLPYYKINFLFFVTLHHW